LVRGCTERSEEQPVWRWAVRPGRVNKPWPVPVQTGPDGTPQAVGRLAVESVREEWLVEDGWWTQKPLQRRYFEVVLEDGSDVVVFSEPDGRWFRQRD
jgi:hypothetical protein